MTREEYLAQFERHLIVGEPKRNELIAELSTHLDELTDHDDALTIIGNPKRLADKYGRTHIGFFRTWRRLLITPVVTAVALAALELGMQAIKSRFFSENYEILDTLNQLMFNTELYTCLIVAGILGKTAAKFNGRAYAFSWLSLVTWVTTYGSVLWIVRGSEAFNSFFASSMMTLGLMAVGMVSAFLSSNIRITNRSQQRLQITLELSVAVLVGFLSFMMLTFMSLMDLAGGTFIPVIIGEGAIAWFFIRRLLRYRIKQ